MIIIGKQVKLILKSLEEYPLKVNNSKNLLVQFTLLRGIDFISWGLCAFYCLALFILQDIYYSSFPYIINVPLFAVVYGSFLIPNDFLDEKVWRVALLKLRSFSLICALNFPFVIFIQMSEKNTYFAICCGLVIYSFVQILLALSDISHQVASRFYEPLLASEGKLSTKMIYIFTLLAVVVMLLYMSDPGFLRELKYSGFLNIILKLLVLLLVFPMIFPVTLLFRLKFALIKKHKEEIRNNYE